MYIISSMSVIEIPKIHLKCQHCKHLWYYKGKRKNSACCPNCKYRVFFKREINSITHTIKVYKNGKVYYRKIEGL